MRGHVLHELLEDSNVQMQPFAVANGVGTVRGDTVEREDHGAVAMKGGREPVHAKGFRHGV
jgi:hypothetical protein